MRIGPSQRVRRAGEVRCAQTTDGSAASVASMSKATSASGDVEASLAALGLPARLEIQGERVDVAEVLDRLLAGSKPERVRVETEGINGRGREQREAVGPRLGGARALQQPVDDDDVRPGQLVPAGDATPDERAVVDEQLEIEPGSQPARVAVAASSPGRCSAAGAGRRGRRPRSRRAGATRRRARPRRTGTRHRPRTWPVGTAAPAGRRSSRGGRRRWRARARSRCPTGRRYSRSGRR